VKYATVGMEPGPLEYSASTLTILRKWGRLRVMRQDLIPEGIPSRRCHMTIDTILNGNEDVVFEVQHARINMGMFIGYPAHR